MNFVFVPAEKHSNKRTVFPFTLRFTVGVRVHFLNSFFLLRFTNFALDDNAAAVIDVVSSFVPIDPSARFSYAPPTLFLVWADNRFRIDRYIELYVTTAINNIRTTRVSAIDFHVVDSEGTEKKNRKSYPPEVKTRALLPPRCRNGKTGGTSRRHVGNRIEFAAATLSYL